MVEVPGHAGMLKLFCVENHDNHKKYTLYYPKNKFVDIFTIELSINVFI